MFLILTCIFYTFCKKKCWWLCFYNGWDSLVIGTAGKISRYEVNRKESVNGVIHDNATACFMFGWKFIGKSPVYQEQVNKCGAFQTVSHSTWLVQKLHSRSLHILFSSSPPPAHCSRHLVSRTSLSALLEPWLLHIMRWKDRRRSRTLARVAQKAGKSAES